MLLLGDFNIAPTDDDVFDADVTKDEILCSDKERDMLSKLLALGFHDLFYDYDFPSQTFTWWDYRGGAFHRDIGYRIDLLLASKTSHIGLKSYEVHRDTRHKSWCQEQPKTSDHAPVMIEI